MALLPNVLSGRILVGIRGQVRWSWWISAIYLWWLSPAACRTLAQSLGIKPSTISRRIIRLEDELGVTIFERGSFGYRLTTAGRDLMVRIRHVLDAADAVAQVEIAGRLNELLGEKAYPNGVRGVWGKDGSGGPLPPFPRPDIPQLTLLTSVPRTRCRGAHTRSGIVRSAVWFVGSSIRIQPLVSHSTGAVAVAKPFSSSIDQNCSSTWGRYPR